ncbi:hypothetical protein [Ralstonia pseudosolanacearum]|nr:hypothetical protein [Ralstonia pseudosolanacearum]MDO3559584.1 hypothetical protein [Ralstonia pseudosolanacearum]
MNKEPTKLYSPPLVRQTGSEMLRVRIERSIVDTLGTLQDHPTVLVKGHRKPSKSILTRRAIQVYADYVRGLKGDAAERENAALHRLA